MAQTHSQSDQHAPAPHESDQKDAKQDETKAPAAPKEPTKAEVLAGIEHLRTAGGPVGMLADAMIRLSK